MAGDIRRRLANLRAKQPKPKPDTRFEPWGEGARKAWAGVSSAQKARWWAAYQRCGGFAGPCLVRRLDDGTWKLSIFNTKFGGCEYAIMSVLHEGGVDDFLAWAEATLSPDELDVLARVMLAKWDPEALQDGDVDVLSGLTPRLPKRRPGSGGGRDVRGHHVNGDAPANPESW
jgi:hypothetical protein